MDAIRKQLDEIWVNTDDSGRREIRRYVNEAQVGDWTEWDAVLCYFLGVSKP
jgi:DNA primase catalytic subunit